MNGRISLNVEYYCHGCSKFSPILSTFYADQEIFSQEVVCENVKECNRIYEYIKNKFEQSEKY